MRWLRIGRRCGAGINAKLAAGWFAPGAEFYAKRARADEPKPETATEKLARLRAKQASLGGMGHFGRVGADYASKSNTTAPAKGIQRYQQMMKDGRT